MLSEGRAKADGLGRWVRSGIGGCKAGSAASSSEALAEASELAVSGFVVRGFLIAAVFGIEAIEEASEAASSSLSSWYLRRLSSGRTPFSM